MTISAMSIAANATSISVTGGTALAYAPDGQLVTNGIHVAANSVADFRVRPHISFKNKNPVRRSDGSFSRGERTIVLTEPYLHTDGIVYYDTYEIKRLYAPVIPVANLDNGRRKAAQVLFDADLENFNTVGDIS